MNKFIPLLFALGSTLWAAEFQAGVARKMITPPTPFWLSGYAARTNPAPTVKNDLWAKALALQDDRGERAVFVTMDLIGLPREVSETVAQRVEKQHGLKRAQLLLNCSHTHAGPVIWPNLQVMFGFDEPEQARCIQYTRKLTDDLAGVVGSALANLSPARLASGHGAAGFAINRREPTASSIRIGQNPAGPMDHDVPVLRVTDPSGKLRAVLFGYACHNTTLGGDFYQINNDYAGAAQRELEAAHPGATAMFMILCGGDQNPHPRGKLENVEAYGKNLAAAVDRVLAGELKSIGPSIRSAFVTTPLDFAAHTRETFAEEAKTTNIFKQRRAKLMLEAYAKEQPVRQVNYPVQAVRFPGGMTFLALGGEVVVDYSLRAKKEFPNENLVVAGYCNEVMCYIPSLRVLREGGYEAVDSMIYYAQPGPFAENVEETVFQAVRQVMAQVGVK